MKRSWQLLSHGLIVLTILVLAGCNDVPEAAAEKETGSEDAGPVSDWPLFRGDPEMQGVSEEVLMPPLEVAWSFEPDSDGGKLPPLEASPIILNGRVYIGTQSSVFFCLDLETGGKNWEFEAEGPITAPAGAQGEQVFFGDTYGFVYALDASTGEEQWRFETEGKIEGGINLVADSEGGLNVLVGSHDYFLYCLDGATGEVLWKHETGNYIVATPSLVKIEDQSQVCFGGCDGLLYFLSTRGNGKGFEVEVGSYIANTSAVRDGIVYVAHNGGEILAVEVESGEEVWRTTTNTEYTASPAVDETHVYVAGPDKRLVAFDRVLGEEQWAFVARRGFDSSPLVSGESIWQAGMDGRIYAVDRQTGEEQWQIDMGTQIKASPAVSRGFLVVGGTDGVVYALRK